MTQSIALHQAYPLLGAKLSRPTVPVYRADGTIVGRADRKDMERTNFVSLIASVARRADKAISRIYLKALPNEVCRPIAEDNNTCVRDGRSYKHHGARCAAYAE